MFDFLSMAGNYEERKVANYKKDDLIVDTCSVTDGRFPYETAVSSLKYNRGKWIIVEAYSTKEDSIAGHNRWVELMTKNPPLTLVDCKNSSISEWIDEDLEYDYADEI